MGAVTYPDGLAIFRLVFFLPSFFCSIFVCVRHGFTKTSGWLYLSIFCLLRIIGSSAQLATINKPTDTTIQTIALICTILGLSPLLLASVGITSRLFYSILNPSYSLVFQLVVLKAIQIAAVVGLILCIVGATSAPSNNPSQIESESTVHIGIILFVAVYIAISVLVLLARLHRPKLPEQERLLLIALICALPLLLVRIVYSLLSAFDHDSDTFSLGNPSTKSTTVQLFMEILEEMAVVALYLAAGIRVKSTPLPQGSSAAEQVGYRAGRGDFGFGGGRLGILSLGLGVVSAIRKGGRRQEEERRLGERHEMKSSGQAV